MPDKKIAETTDVIASIEQHYRVRRTRPSVHAGAMALAGWNFGKRVTAAEYDKAVQAFLKSKGGGVHA